MGNDKNIGLPSPQCQSINSIWYQMICQQKITNPLTNKRRILINIYFYIDIFNLLNFYTNDIVSFDNNNFFNAYFNKNLLFGCLVASFNGTLRFVRC